MYITRSTWVTMPLHSLSPPPNDTHYFKILLSHQISVLENSRMHYLAIVSRMHSQLFFQFIFYALLLKLQSYTLICTDNITEWVRNQMVIATYSLLLCRWIDLSIFCLLMKMFELKSLSEIMYLVLQSTCFCSHISFWHNLPLYIIRGNKIIFSLTSHNVL